MATDYRTYPYFFPLIGREEAEKYLAFAPVSTFLLRRSSKPECLVFSLKQLERILHLLVVRCGNGWGMDPDAWTKHPIGQLAFPTIQVLVERMRQYNILGDYLIIKKNKSGEGPAIQGVPDTELMKAEQAQRVEAAVMDMNLEHEYKGMVQMLINSDARALTPASFEKLSAWRVQHHFLDTQHERVLSLVGINSADYDDLKASVLTRSSDSSSSSTCVVCLENQRDMVFLPCAHMVCCSKCAPRLTGKPCPNCRATVTQALKVFT